MSSFVHALLFIHPQAKGGFASGVRVDLRKAMACEADPRHYIELWQRRKLPDRTDLVVYVLVDLSGSMRRGGKIDAAVAGVVIMIEAFARMEHVRWAVAGFQNELIPIAEFGEGLTTSVRERIENCRLEVEDKAPGGNNNAGFNDDGPAVLEAGRQLLALASSRQLLIVVSDEVPEGMHSNEKDLEDAVREIDAAGVSLIGVGIGERTGHVSKYYPRHLANVSVSEFPQKMGALIRELLTE